MSRKRNITIQVDSELYKEVMASFKARGTDLQTFVELQLRAFSSSKAKSNMDLGDLMPYGKYRGARIEDIIRGDLGYAVYLVGQDAKFSGASLELIKELSK